MFKKLVWFARRASVMDASEIGYRLVSLFRVVMVKLGLDSKAKTLNSAKVNSFSLDNFQALKQRLEFNTRMPCDDIANEMRNANFPVFGSCWSFRDNHDWNRCQLTCHNWDNAFYAAIDYRSGEDKGDIRIVWEPARLQMLTPLALLYTKTQDTTFKSLYSEILADYRSKFQPYLGPHNVSVMEHALRILSVTFSLSLLEETEAERIIDDLNLSGFIMSHAHLVSSRLSLHSSTGNHTIAEAASLVVAGYVFANSKDSKRWFEKGRSILVEQLIQQTYEDGGSREHASWYLKFIFELTSVANACLRKEDTGVLKSRMDSIGSMLRALDISCFPESIGDSDHGFAISEFIDFLPPKVKKQTVQYEQSGIVLAHQEQTSILIDYGSLGLHPNYGHGHSDSLSVYATLFDQPFLVDLGTYAYNSDDSKRNSYRSTTAHNTICVNNENLDEMRGRFQWKERSKSQLLLSEIRDGLQLFVLKECGYLDRFGVKIIRGVGLAEDGSIIVIDEIVGSCDKAEVNWHFHPDVAISNNLKTLNCAGNTVHFGVDSTNDFSISKEACSHSNNYLKERETNRISLRFTVKDHQRVTSFFSIDDSNAVENNKVKHELVQLMAKGK